MTDGEIEKLLAEAEALIRESQYAHTTDGWGKLAEEFCDTTKSLVSVITEQAAALEGMMAKQEKDDGTN